MNSTKDEAGEECNKWLEHLASNHGIQNWPENMVRVVLEDGPERRMRQSSALETLVPFSVLVLGFYQGTRKSSRREVKGAKINPKIHAQ